MLNDTAVKGDIASLHCLVTAISAVLNAVVTPDEWVVKWEVDGVPHNMGCLESGGSPGQAACEL